MVLFGLREVFRDIFHPTRSGTLSEYVGRLTSLLMRRTRLRPAVRELGVPRLLELAQAVLQFRIDITLFPVLLNFYAAEQESTVAHVLPKILRFAHEAAACDDTAVRLGGVQLQIALDSLAESISDQVIQGGQQTIEEVFNAFERREQ
jgi:hypothetical protein